MWFSSVYVLEMYRLSLVLILCQSKVCQLISVICLDNFLCAVFVN